VRDTARALDACMGPDLGAPYVAPPLARSHADAISRPPRRLRVGIVDTTFTGAPIHKEVADQVRDAGSLVESLGHIVVPHQVRADVAMMMRAWTDIVAVGTALSIRGGLAGRALTGDLWPMPNACRRCAILRRSARSMPLVARWRQSSRGLMC